MSVARAIAKTIPAGGTAVPRGSRGRKPRREELLVGLAPVQAAAAVSEKTLRVPAKRGSYKVSSKTDQRRLDELKVKLGDPDYMEGAILRIATVLSARLTLR